MRIFFCSLVIFFFAVSNVWAVKEKPEICGDFKTTFPPAMDWFHKRYPVVYSECEGPEWTDEMERNCNVPRDINAFAVREYESLLDAAVLCGGIPDGRAYEIINLLYKHLHDRPEDKRFEELKKKAYSLAVLERVSRTGVIRNVPDSIPGYRDYAKAIIEKQPGMLRYFTESVRNDRDLVLLALSKTQADFKYASARLRDDRDLVLHFATQTTDEEFLQYISIRLRNDPEILGAFNGIVERKRKWEEGLKSSVEDKKRDDHFRDERKAQ